MNREFPYLMSPFTLGSTELKNRIVVAPMGTGLAAEDGTVSERLVGFLERFAQGGVGLVITEGINVDDKESRVLPVGGLGVYGDKCIPGFKVLAESIKEHGCAIIGQISHAGGSARPEFIGGLRPLAPSGVRTEGDGVVPRKMTLEKIRDVEASFLAASVRLEKAGFDGIELHGAHHVLFNQFLSPRTNRRRDAYGGSLKNRARVVLEIVASVRENLPSTFIVGYRICADEKVPGGISYDDVIAFARLLEEAGCDYISVTSGTNDSPLYMFPSMYMPAGSNLALAQGIKQAVSIPIMSAGGIDVQLGEEAIRRGQLDLVAIARGLLADPDLAAKVNDNKVADIRPCIRCNGCMTNMYEAVTTGKEVDLGCVLYPRGSRMERTSRAKKIMVVGGGPGGMAAAQFAAARGHRVVLLEKGSELGGHLLEASAPEFKAPLRPLLAWLKVELEESGVEVRLDCEGTSELVERESPDVLILAIGSDYFVPEGLGHGSSSYLLPDAVLLGRAGLGDQVVVAGGGTVGCEAAIYAAEGLKRRVILVECLSGILRDEEPLTALAIRERLQAAGVDVRTGIRIDACLDDGALCTDQTGSQILIEADSIVLALGLRASQEPAAAFAGTACSVLKVGDCVEAKDLRCAFDSAWQAASRC